MPNAASKPSHRPKPARLKETVRLVEVFEATNHVDTLDDFVDWLNDQRVVRYSEQRHRKHTYWSQYEFFEAFNGWSGNLWLIYVGDILLGSISCTIDLENKTANLGILIGNRKYWGKGHGAAAWKQACKLLWESGIRKIEAGCMAKNKAMLRVFKKTGMKVEGRIKEHFLLKKKPVDMILVGLWRPRHD